MESLNNINLKCFKNMQVKRKVKTDTLPSALCDFTGDIFAMVDYIFNKNHSTVSIGLDQLVILSSLCPQDPELFS